MQLFVERGFAATTVPEIAAHAGLTTRTYFRHFDDKREVLFAAERELPQVVAGVMADAPAGLPPLPLIEHGLLAVTASRFTGLADLLRIRRSIIETDEGLQERELRKNAVLGDAIARSLSGRSFDPLTVRLTSQLAVAIFTASLARWLDDESRSLTEYVAEAFAVVRALG